MAMRGGLKRKIPIEKIEIKSSRAVAFTKRRKGLFSKAAEFCLLEEDDQIAILARPVSSNSRTPFYSFGHSSVDSVVEAFLANERLKENLGFWWDDEKVRESDDLDVLTSAVDSISSLLNDLKEDLKKNDGLYQNQTLIPQICSPSHGFNNNIEQEHALVAYGNSENNGLIGNFNGFDQTLIPRTCSPSHGFNNNIEQEHALVAYGNLNGFDQVQEQYHNDNPRYENLWTDSEWKEMVTQNLNDNCLSEEYDDLIESIFGNSNNNDGNALSGNLDESNEELDYDQIIDYDTDYETSMKIFDDALMNSMSSLHGAV